MFKPFQFRLASLHAWQLPSAVLLVLALLWLGSGPALAQTVDLPLCERASVAENASLTLGIVQPGASESLVNYAAALSLADERLSVCAEPWSLVWPRWAPWSGVMERGIGWVVFALALVLAVTLLARLTPRHWWRRTSLLGMLSVLGLTWILGVASMAVLYAAGTHRWVYDTVVGVRLPMQLDPVWLNLRDGRDLQVWLAQRDLLPSRSREVPQLATQPAQAIGSESAGLPAGDSTSDGAAPPSASADAEVLASHATLTPNDIDAPSGLYKVIHRLNLRSGPGTHSDLLLTISRGNTVEFDGQRQGDWWRVKTQAGIVGWCSSLWLRQPGELAAKPADVKAGP